MSGKRRKAPPAKRPWVPLQPATASPRPPEQIAALREQAVQMGIDPDHIEREATREVEVWMNDRYTVIVERRPNGSVDHLSIRRNDRKADIPWRHMQRMKNELAGAETEAFELYPAESRLMDTANQYWLWCLPPGQRLPLGFNLGRQVDGPESAAAVGARQARLDE